MIYMYLMVTITVLFVMFSSNALDDSRKRIKRLEEMVEINQKNLSILEREYERQCSQLYRIEKSIEEIKDYMKLIDKTAIINETKEN